MERPFVIVLLSVAPPHAAAASDPSALSFDAWADPEDPAGLAAREAAAHALQRALERAAPGLQRVDDYEDRASFVADLLAEGVPPRSLQPACGGAS